MSGAIGILLTLDSTGNSLTVALDSNINSGFIFGYGVCRSYTTTTASPAGGSPGYTYSWSRVSGSTAISATDPTSYYTYFSATMTPPSLVSAVFRVTVTDSLGATATADVTVTLSSYDNPTGGIIP